VRPIGQGRLGGWQVLWLVVAVGATEDSTVLNRLLTPLAGRDLWISILLAAPFALLGVAAILAAGRSVAPQGLGALCRQLPPAIGYPLGLAYAALFLAQATVSAAEFTGVSHQVFHATPPSAFLLPLIAVALYGCMLGLEVIARVNAALLLLVDVPLGIALALIALHQEKLTRLLPVLASGWGPPLQGAWLVFGFFGQFSILLALWPALPRELPRAFPLWSVASVTFMALGHNLGPLLTFGQAATIFTYPEYQQVRVLQAGRFLERLDVVAVWLWVHGFWIEVALFLYAATAMVTDMVSVRRPLRLAVTFAVAVYLAALLGVPDQSVSEALRRELDTVAFPLLGFGVPLLMLLNRGLGRRRGGVGGRVGARGRMRGHGRIAPAAPARGLAADPAAQLATSPSDGRLRG
jgi:spore germination protein KB